MAALVIQNGSYLSYAKCCILTLCTILLMKSTPRVNFIIMLAHGFLNEDSLKFLFMNICAEISFYNLASIYSAIAPVTVILQVCEKTVPLQTQSW